MLLRRQIAVVVDEAVAKLAVVHKPDVAQAMIATTENAF